MRAAAQKIVKDTSVDLVGRRFKEGMLSAGTVGELRIFGANDLPGHYSTWGRYEVPIAALFRCGAPLPVRPEDYPLDLRVDRGAEYVLDRLSRTESKEEQVTVLLQAAIYDRLQSADGPDDDLSDLELALRGKVGDRSWHHSCTSDFLPLVRGIVQHNSTAHDLLTAALLSFERIAQLDLVTVDPSKKLPRRP